MLKHDNLLNNVCILFRLIIFILCVTFCGAQELSPESRSLLSLNNLPLLAEYHRITTNYDRQEFHYPKRDSLLRKNLNSDSFGPMLTYQDRRSLLFVSVVGDVAMKGNDALKDTVFPSIDGGLFLRGWIDSVEFSLDARIFSELHSSNSPASFDGEFIDFQRKDNNDGLEYVSFSRYKGHLAFNLGFARVDFARDVVHWGPGYYNNLSLNRLSLPFNSASIDFSVGPLSVVSIIGDLRIYKNNAIDENKKQRKLYGHRYELNLDDLVIGISELQTIYDNDNLWLFVPIVPLFMEKGNYAENSNNGSLSFDLNYRLFKTIRLYSEFFLDDMQSPYTLIKNDNAQAKWAWMAGFHFAFDYEWNNHLLEFGVLSEYARVEPYVYTHFKENSAQFANLEEPIGNQGGPNSQTVDLLVYAKLDKRFFLSVQQKWFWKGTDYGSSLNDSTPDHHCNVTKSFLKGGNMRYSLIPSLTYINGIVSYLIELSVFNEKRYSTKIGFMW